jgi:hypothetical protein
VAGGLGRPTLVAHEKFRPQKFDAPSEITVVDQGKRLEWVSLPPMNENNRGKGGRVTWGYERLRNELLDVVVDPGGVPPRRLSGDPFDVVGGALG